MSFDNSQFMLNKISHELRNPLTIIYSTLQLIESKHPEAKSFCHWPELIQDVEFMACLLEDLSHFSHADSLHLSSFSFRSFLEYISLSFAASVAETDMEYISKIDSSINQITGDKTKLQEVFLNLLKNAYDAAMPDNTISLYAYAKKDSIVVNISDTGCGISEDVLPSIFEPFTTYKKDGTGLGLAIADHIIKAHHGQIKVSTVLGVGTTFEVTLPTQQKSDSHSGE